MCVHVLVHFIHLPSLFFGAGGIFFWRRVRCFLKLLGLLLNTKNPKKAKTIKNQTNKNTEGQKSLGRRPKPSGRAGRSPVSWAVHSSLF